MATPKITLQQIQQRANSKSYARGLQYYKDEAIFDAIKRGNLIEGYCEGSEDEPYRVVVAFNDAGILSTSCTCLYDYDGDCKHIVALLLTYFHNAELFPERPPLDQVLEKRSQAELIALVQQMVSLYPDLEKLLDHPLPNETVAATSISTDSFKREIRRAMQSYDGWGDNQAVRAVNIAAKNAKLFATRGDWRNASAIYCAILEECCFNEYVMDEEGDFGMALGEVVDGLEECLQQPELVKDDAERLKILLQLLNVEFWDVELGGYGVSDGVSDMLLAHATPADLAEIRPRIEKVQTAQRKKPYGKWGAESLEQLLIDLDVISSTDPEETLKRLREQEMHPLLLEKLVALNRLEEALAVVREFLPEPYERLRAGTVLSKAGHIAPAIELMQETLKQNFDQGIVTWLLDQYYRSGDKVAYLELQHKRMLATPYEGYYLELKTAAQAVDRWEAMRPELLQHLEKQKQHPLLTKIHLYDEEWEAAWQRLEKVKANLLHEALELEVAEKSRAIFPRKALPIFITHARKAIDRRDRNSYRLAAEYLVIVRELYEQIEDEAAWESLIKQIRAEFKRLPALQDEFNQAGLYSY